MSNIRNKISSIEADDDVVTKALGLRPTAENEIVERTVKPDSDKVERVASASDNDAPMPAIISRNSSFQSGFVEESSKWPTNLTIGLGVMWLIGTGLTTYFAFDLDKIASFSPMAFGGLAFFILFPLLLLALLYIGLRKLVLFSTRAARLETAANALMHVDETVVRRATEMSGVVKREIDSLNSNIDTALTRAATLQGVLEEQTQKLGETSLAVEDKTQQITKRLSTEREALWSISNTFDEQMKVLAQTLDTLTEKLAISTKTAEQKIQEVRVSVESTAAKINQTSDLVRSNTMEAASTLSDNQSDILKLSEQLKASAQEIDTIYQKHGQDLGAMIAQLQNEQEVLNLSLEDRLSKMRDVALSAQVSAERLTEASEAGRQTVTSLSEAAKLSEDTIRQRFSEVEEMVKFSNARAESISDKAARRVQDSLAQTRKEIARIESDMLGLEQKLTGSSKTQPDEIVQEAKVDVVDQIEAQDIVPAKKKRGILNIHPMEEMSETRPKSGMISSLMPAPSSDRDDPSRPIIEQDAETIEIPSYNSRESLELKIEDDIIEPSAPIIPERTLADDRIRRAVKEPKTSGSWLKSLFGKNASETTAIDALTTPAQSQTPPSIPKASELQIPMAETPVVKTSQTATPNIADQDDFLKTLTQNGLSPSAIVDDGTILRAVETRATKGTKQMSMEVASRLGDPIKHFASLIDKDETLKTQAINFAVKFHHSLGPLSGDKEAMQAHLQSEQGRLFLMCDAALNN